MKNVILIPTTEKSKLCIRDVDSRFCLHRPEVTYHGENQHMYILCDDAIYTGEWCFEVHNGKTIANYNTPNFTDDKGNVWWLRKANANDIAGCETTKKIALTTNPMLFKDDVQEISEEFLLWYINNRTDNVKVEHNLYNLLGRKIEPNDVNVNRSSSKWKYDIIIPKEVLKTSAEWQAIYKEIKVYDPDGWDRKNYQYSWFEELISLDEYHLRRMHSTCMGMIKPDDEIKPEDIWNEDKVEELKDFIDKINDKKETLEEAAEKCFEEMIALNPKGGIKNFIRMAVNYGANWQAEQMFSLEEIKEIARKSFCFYRRNDLNDDELEDEFEVWLNKLNKK